MVRRCIIWLLVAGIAHVNANQCTSNSDNRTECYKTLVHYQTVSFPLYGHDEKTLDETCNKMNNSLECIHKYKETCLGKGECSDNCTKVTKSIINFLRQGGFEKFEKELCLNDTALRQTYLEDIDCLQENVEKYAACRITYGASLFNMETAPGAVTEETLCCYLSLYSDCLANVTRENCGVSGIFYMTKAIDLIIGEKLDLCDPTTICERLPTSPEKPQEEAQNSAVKTTLNSCFAKIFALLHIFIVSRYIL